MVEGLGWGKGMVLGDLLGKRARYAGGGFLVRESWMDKRMYGLALLRTLNTEMETLRGLDMPIRGVHIKTGNSFDIVYTVIGTEQRREIVQSVSRPHPFSICLVS